MPVSYLREDGTLERQSVFAAAPAFTMFNGEIGAYVQDRWQPAKGWSRGLLVEPGLRFDWDEIVRRALVAPRLAAVYTPGGKDTTKISAGIGLYYDHTQLNYLAQTQAGIRYDTYYAADGMTPTGPARGDRVYSQRRLAARAAGIELERGRGAKAAVGDLCGREFSWKADDECFYVFESKWGGSACGRLSADERARGSLQFSGVRRAKAVCKWI